MGSKSRRSKNCESKKCKFRNCLALLDLLPAETVGTVGQPITITFPYQFPFEILDWQKSIDNGRTWINTYVHTRYITIYPTLFDNGNLYRLLNSDPRAYFVTNPTKIVVT